MLRVKLSVLFIFDSVYRHFHKYYSFIVAVSFIGGGNRRTWRKPQTRHWQTLSHNVVHLALIEIRTHNISGDTITATMAPRVKVNLNVDEIDDEKISSSSESRQIINNFQVCYTKPLIINMQFFSCITERTSYIRWDDNGDICLVLD